MSRQRRYSRRDDPVGAIAILLFIAAGYLLTAFEQSPLLVSMGGGALFTTIFWLVWVLLYRRRKKRAQWAASSQLYNDLSDQEFEFAVAELFRLQGFDARVTAPVVAGLPDRATPCPVYHSAAVNIIPVSPGGYGGQ